MVRLVLTLSAVLFLVGAAAAQVPYTQSPFPSWGAPRAPSPMAPQAPSIWDQTPDVFGPMTPTAQPQPMYRRRPSVSDSILGDINRSIGQPYRQQESEYDRMMREFRERSERYFRQEQQAEQARQIERAIRCNRFGSREVYGDCHGW